jgi:Skp family chaperone for outer membrane proteins
MAFVAPASLSLRTSSAPASASSAFAGARVVASAPARAVMTMNLDTIQVRIQEEMQKAQEATAKFGKSSKEAAVAWDLVEELEAEASHMKSKQGTVDPLDKYCEDVPDADECRIYED